MKSNTTAWEMLGFDDLDASKLQTDLLSGEDRGDSEDEESKDKRLHDPRPA